MRLKSVEDDIASTTGSVAATVATAPVAAEVAALVAAEVATAPVAALVAAEVATAPVAALVAAEVAAAPVAALVAAEVATAPVAALVAAEVAAAPVAALVAAEVAAAPVAALVAAEVAALVASTKLIALAFAGVSQVAPMVDGKLTNINARPAKAGLNTFAPIPPKNSFATIIAKTPPKATCQSGTVGGQTKASKIPVTIAEQSFTRIFCFVASWKSASEATQLTIEVKITKNALNP